MTRWLAMLAALWALSGCYSQPAKIDAGGVKVTGVKDAGSPAKLDKAEAATTIEVPAQSKLVVTETKAQPAQAATAEAPAVPAVPARIVSELVFPAPTRITQTSSQVAASTGTVDTSIAKHKIDAEAREPFLYAAIVSLLGAGFFMYRGYPVAAGCGAVAALVFFLFYQLDKLPPWLWAVAVAALAVAAGLYFGYNKHEHDKTS